MGCEKIALNSGHQSTRKSLQRASVKVLGHGETEAILESSEVKSKHGEKEQGKVRANSPE